jgi:hypothetical protein
MLSSISSNVVYPKLQFGNVPPTSGLILPSSGSAGAHNVVDEALMATSSQAMLKMLYQKLVSMITDLNPDDPNATSDSGIRLDNARIAESLTAAVRNLFSAAKEAGIKPEALAVASPEGGYH